MYFFCIIEIVELFGDKLAIIQKIAYTQDSINDSGGESNIDMRIGAWVVYLKSIVLHPQYLIIGYGFNTEAYVSIINDITRTFKSHWVPIPESFFVQNAMYGGIICFIYGIKLWKCIFNSINEVIDEKIRIPIKALFYGVLFGNVFSGATIVCDIFYSYILMFFALLLKEEDNF